MSKLSTKDTISILPGHSDVVIVKDAVLKRLALERFVSSVIDVLPHEDLLYTTLSYCRELIIYIDGSKTEKLTRIAKEILNNFCRIVLNFANDTFYRNAF